MPQETLERAKKAILEEHLSIREAAKQFGVSKSTLHDYVSKIHVKEPGGQTVPTEDEEKVLVSRGITMGKWGFPLDAMDLPMLYPTHSKLARESLILRNLYVNN